MDGTSRTALHSTGLSAPYGLTLDYDTQTLYWTDYTLDNLESSSADGRNRRLLTRINIQCPYGLTFFDQRLYWGDWCQHVIYSTLVNSPNSANIVISTGNDPYRIHVVSEERQPIRGTKTFYSNVTSKPVLQQVPILVTLIMEIAVIFASQALPIQVAIRVHVPILLCWMIIRETVSVRHIIVMPCYSCN